MAHRCICLNCLGKTGDVALPEGVSLAVDFKASKPTPGPFSLSLYLLPVDQDVQLSATGCFPP